MNGRSHKYLKKKVYLRNINYKYQWVPNFINKYVQNYIYIITFKLKKKNINHWHN